MSVPSLTQLAASKVPLGEIFEQGLLSAPLKRSELNLFQERVTLENLYLEGLLTSDLDTAILWMALEKSAPSLIWNYLNENLDYGEIPNFPPLSQQGLAFLEEINGYSKKESEAATEDALRDILTDLLEILDHAGEYFIIEQQVGFTWDYLDGYRIFLIPSGPATAEEAESSGEMQVPIVYQSATLDDFVRDLVQLFGQFDYTGRLNFRRASPTQLEIQQQVGLSALRNAYGGNLDAIYDRLWNQGGVILTDGNLDLTLSSLSAQAATIRTIGDYVYIFFSYSRPLYFTGDDGNLVIASLAYNPKRWEFITST